MPIPGEICFSGKTIFFAALDWGLGHSSRSVPVINALLINNKVILGATTEQAVFFDRYFPQITRVVIPSYRIRYSASLPAWCSVLLRTIHILRAIAAEQQMLKTILRQQKVDVVISDNRFGIFSRKLHSVCITHQYNVRSPFLANFANSINRKLLRRFNEIWIPDFADDRLSLAGSLSRSAGTTMSVRYIGPLSALVSFKNSAAVESDILILLSGPEPSRTQLEEILVNKLKTRSGKVVLVRGTLQAGALDYGLVKKVDLADGAQLAALIRGAKLVICRSGYSTLMDLHVLGQRSALLIPTPGQTEQEYLAALWRKKFGYRTVSQNKVALQDL